MATQQAGHPGLFIVATASAAVPPAAVIVFFSQVSHLSAPIVNALSQMPTLRGVHIWVVPMSIAMLGVFILWAMGRGKDFVPLVASTSNINIGTMTSINPNSSENADMWHHDVLWWVSSWSFFVLGVVAAVLSMPYHACLATAFLSGSGCFFLFALRRTCYQDVPAADWFSATSLAFSSAAAVCFLTWFTWIAVGFPSRQNITDWTETYVYLVEKDKITWKIAFVAWIAPLAMTVQLGLAALLCWCRRQHCLLHESDEIADQAKKTTWIVSSVKQISAWIAVFILLAWLHAALSATWESHFDQEREDLRDEVLWLGFFAFVVVFIWTADTLGPDELKQAASKSKVVQETWNMMKGDWCKAALFLACGPLICVLKVTDSLAARVAQRRGKKPRKPLLWFIQRWSWTSVVVKAIWLGLLYISIAVGFAKFTNVLLAYMNECLAGLPVFTISATMFALGVGLFLLPPAPGPPIYVVMGIVISSSAINAGWYFGAAVAWSTFVAFAMKLTFTCIAQKFIGEALSENDTVRSCCELHTPYMRAVESILMKDGLTLAKVTLLVGGPDWPVAVLCGILRLPVLQVQLGTSPVLVQSVFPCVLAGAMMLKNGMEDRKQFGMGEVCLAMAGALQCAAAAIAFFYVQETLETEYEALTEPREKDRKLLELDEKHKEETTRYWKEMTWEYLPVWVQCVLATGFLVMQLSIILLCGPWGKVIGKTCFKPFGLQSSVSRDLNGNPLAIVLPLGWVALIFAATSTLCLTIFYIYAQRAGSKDKAETMQLVQEEQEAVPAA